jgi:glycosyltransferase involved in cell wall biosynthesis
MSSRGNPQLSVVVCSLGRARLEDAVRSVLDSAAQARVEIEIVVVWQSESPAPELAGCVRVLEVFPLGLAHARNRGLAATEAALVGFVDDDELVDPGWVAAALQAFAASPRPAAAFGPVAPLDDRGLPYCRLEPGSARAFDRPSTPPWVVGTGGNMVFDGTELRGAGGFDPLLGAGAEGRAGEETELIVRLLRRRRRIVWVPDLGVYHPTKYAEEHLAVRFPYAYGMGRALRKHRAAAHAVRYLRSIADAFVAARREHDERRGREVRATLRGFLAGLLRPVDRRSPLTALEHAPAALRAEVEAGGWQALPLRTESPPRLAYRRNGAVLEIWTQPSSADAEAAARGARVVPGRDALWRFVTPPI